LRIGARNGELSLREAALDCMAQAVALLDAGGKVLFANRHAEAIFRAGNGLAAVNGHLAATDAQSASWLKEALRLAASGQGSSARLHDAAGQPAWVATFCPADTQRSSRNASPHPSPVLQPQPPRRRRLAGLYRLSPAETRVLQHLLDQKSTQDIADALHISIKTLRTHLSNLFVKTGTTGQRELVRFYLAHPSVNPPADF
jgi:DNA-binding CsgD family transcriptional regulator